MASSKTIKVRLLIECDYSRQEVYDAIGSRFCSPPSEKQMDAVWAWLSERSLGYTDVTDAMCDLDADNMAGMMTDALADTINSQDGLLEEEEVFEPAPSKEQDETDGWEQVYNGGEDRKNPLLSGQGGTFYQTYGNGGGAGGSGGYWHVFSDYRGYWALPEPAWEMPGVYEVAGQEFKLLENVELEFRPENSSRGVVAAVRIVPLTPERIAENLRKKALYQKAVAKREARLAQRDEDAEREKTRPLSSEWGYVLRVAAAAAGE